MRAIAYLLLGLLALTAVRPACAMPVPRASATMAHAGQKAHEGCPETRDRRAHHACAMASCVGCALGFARAALPVGSPRVRPVRLNAAPAVRLAGLGPVAAIPPPRPIA